MDKVWIHSDLMEYRQEVVAKLHGGIIAFV
jgi:hypothetical protein